MDVHQFDFTVPHSLEASVPRRGPPRFPPFTTRSAGFPSSAAKRLYLDGLLWGLNIDYVCW